MTTFQREGQGAGVPPRSDAAGDPRVFVVRVWPRASAFRASAREVHCDDTVVFDEPHALLRFLACTPDEPADASGAARLVESIPDGRRT